LKVRLRDRAAPKATRLGSHARRGTPPIATALDEKREPSLTALSGIWRPADPSARAETPAEKNDRTPALTDGPSYRDHDQYKHAYPQRLTEAVDAVRSLLVGPDGERDVGGGAGEVMDDTAVVGKPR
jgi:hypothetical protein